MAPLISRLLKEAFLSSCPAADRINWFNLFFGSDSVLSLSVPPITPSDWLHVASEPIKTEGSESLSFYFYCKWKSVPVINLFSNFCFSDETTKTFNCKQKLQTKSNISTSCFTQTLFLNVTWTSGEGSAAVWKCQRDSLSLFRSEYMRNTCFIVSLKLMRLQLSEVVKSRRSPTK